MGNTAFLLMIITLASKSLGFIREITLSYFYGANNISDAYIISRTIPDVIFALVGTGIATTYIPIYNNIINNDSEIRAKKFSNNLINFLMIISTIIILIVLFNNRTIVKLFASGFNEKTVNIAVGFTKITIYTIYINCIYYVIKSYLHIQKNYKITAISGLPLNLIIIISIYLSDLYGLKLLSLGLIFANIFQILILFYYSYQNGFRYEIHFDFKDKYLKKMFFLALPVIIGTSVNQINILVDRTLASRILVGGISSLNYASKLNGVIMGVFVLSISTVMYPLISEMYEKKNISKFKEYIKESIIVVIVLIIPITFGTIIFSKPIISLFFERGEFGIREVNITAYILTLYSIGMIGYALREIFSRVFYAMQDTKTPVFNATIGLILNIFLNISLSRVLGLGGLALATSISALFTSCLLFINLQRKINSLNVKVMVKPVLKVFFSSIIMSIFSYINYNFFLNYYPQKIVLIISVFLGVMIYFSLIYILKIKEINKAYDVFLKRFKK